MKISHIIALLVIAVGIAIMVTSMSESSQYVSFAQADSIAVEDPEEELHVVGKLKKDAQGNIIGMFYDPKVDVNLFQFILVDNNGQERTVILHDTKPQGMEETEQVVVVGHSEKNVFMAKQVLTKCPSKYKEENPEISIK